MATTKPTILVISIGEAFEVNIFDDTQADVLNKILEKAHVKRAKTSKGALNVLNEGPPPQGVYVVTPGIMTKKNTELAGKLVDYAKAGGIVVYGGCMSSFAGPVDLGAMFRNTWGLRWEAGDYHRTTVSLNTAAAGLNGSAGELATSYSQKALNLKNVDASDCWYLPSADSRIESHVFAPAPIENSNETPVAFRKIEQGWVGYTGDVNSEQTTTSVVLRMFGLV
jgi:hypothetical protein